METKADFTKVRHFPGTVGNPFDIFLHKFVELERIPGIIFAVILFGWAVLVTGAVLPVSMVMWGFFLLDWLLLALLPKAGRSFGPAKPIVLILMVLRSIFLLLPPVFDLAIQVIGTLLVLYGFWYEPHRLTVTHERLATAKLPKGTKIRVLHLGDLHIERITGREQALNRLVEALEPDLILFSGDFLNLSYLHDPQAQADCRTVISQWKAPLGVYAVTGSPAVDLDDVIPGLLKDMPLRWLRDERVCIPVGDSIVDVIGLNCTHKPFLDAPRLEELTRGGNPHFTMLIYHSPDLAPEAAELGMDLQVSGHTHGGQIRVPGFGAFFAASLYGKRFESGRYQVGQMTLYTTRGIGMEGQAAPRVRVFCPPEIILWEIEGV